MGPTGSSGTNRGLGEERGGKDKKRKRNFSAFLFKRGERQMNQTIRQREIQIVRKGDNHRKKGKRGRQPRGVEEEVVLSSV